MDWNTWCKLCGSVDAILKPDQHQEEVILKLAEINLDGSVLCLECISFLNNCIEFTNKSKHIQLMFNELLSSDRNQINFIRSQYELPPIHISDSLNNGLNEVHIIIETNECDNENSFQSDDEYILEEKLVDSNDDNGSLDVQEIKEKMPRSEIEKLYSFKCHVCDEEFSKMQNLTDHCKNLHNVAPQVDCHCGKKLSTWKRLMDHRLRHKGNDELQCLDCKLIYKTQQAYEKHVEKKHGKNAIKFICSICGRSFKEKQILKNHEKIHLPDELKLKYPCTQCDKKFTNSSCLKVHIARIHEKVAYFFCEVCGKGCTTKSDLICHMDKHVQEKNYPCDICGLKFKSTNALRIHKRRHQATEPTVQCPICNKEFRSNTALSNHKLVHSNERKYKCQYCPNSYKRLETYKCHLSTHTGLRPFKCPWCSRTFVNSANCRKHKLKTHPKEVEEFEALYGKRGVSLAIKT